MVCCLMALVNGSSALRWLLSAIVLTTERVIFIKGSTLPGTVEQPVNGTTIKYNDLKIFEAFQVELCVHCRSFVSQLHVAMVGVAVLGDNVLPLFGIGYKNNTEHENYMVETVSL